MNEAMKTYNGYVEQEDRFYKRLEMLEHCQSAISNSFAIIAVAIIEILSCV